MVSRRSIYIPIVGLLRVWVLTTGDFAIKSSEGSERLLVACKFTSGYGMLLFFLRTRYSGNYVVGLGYKFNGIFTETLKNLVQRAYTRTSLSIRRTSFHR